MSKRAGAIAEGQPPLDELFHRVLDGAADNYDPWLYRYCGDLASSAEATRYRRHLESLLRFGRIDVRGKRALDAGCGFGFTLLALRWLGASEVFGVDTSEAMIKTVRAFLPLLPKDFAAGVQVTEAGVSDLPYEDESFDLVLSIEAISHYRDVGAFTAEVARVLRPGGTLLIRDGNNARNPRVRRETRALWDEFETGRPSVLGEKHERQGSYRLRREEIIRAAFPEADDAEVEDLVSRTAFMNRAQIVAAIREYRAGGAPPASFYDGSDAPVDPNSDAVIERLFDPYRLADSIRASGFATRVAGYWGGAGGNPFVRAANGALVRLSRIAISSAPAFMIAARRL
jgi:SAM-dependent methyltransferase